MTKEEKRKEQLREYYQKNKEKIKEYREKNEEKIKEYHQEYHQKNKEKRKEYREKNKKKIKEYKRTYLNNRKQTDMLFKLRCNISVLISVRLKRKGYTKNSKTHQILGCTYEEFKTHLEKQFEPWMNWENYGKYQKDTYSFGWDIDHVIPISGAETETELLKLNHYTNLKPLCSKINRDVKRDNMNRINSSTICSAPV